jgi:signal transduction histidine kinase
VTSSPRTASRAPLEARTALVMAAVVTLAVVVAGAVTLGLVRSAAEAESRQALTAQADLVAAVVDAARPADIAPVLRVVRRERNPVAWHGATGRLVGDALARTAYTSMSPGERDRTGSHTVSIEGSKVLVEVRAVDGNRTVVFAQRSALAAGTSLQLLPRVLLALAVGLVVAVVSSVLFARRLAAPLRRTADAARRLASGERSVRVRAEGPREVAELGESLNALGEALEQSEGRQREFLLSVSHELRTPLTAVTGFAEAIADGVASGDDAVRAGRTIQREAVRLERLVTDLLELARLGADEFRLDPAPVDLAALVRDCAEVWQLRCAREDVRLSVSAPASPVPVVADARRLRQVVDGLAENALRVTPAGAPMVFSLSVSGSSTSLSVRDGGPGLAPEDYPVAFERGVLNARYRDRRPVGSGIGLALVHGLVTRMGGTLTAGPAPEGGAAFTITFPLAATSATVPLPRP